MSDRWLDGGSLGYVAVEAASLLFPLHALAVAVAVLAATPLIRSPWPLVAANPALWFVVAAATPVLNPIVADGVPEGRWNARRTPTTSGRRCGTT